MSTIKNMELEHFIGLMEENTMGLGKMASNMVGASITSPLEKKRLDSGYKANGLNSGSSKLQLKLNDDVRLVNISFLILLRLFLIKISFSKMIYK